MVVRETGIGAAALRSRWCAASLAAGWRYPSDWATAEVDAVCRAAAAGADLAAPLAALGRARAHGGACLAETLTDLAALHAVLTAPDGLVAPDPDALPVAFLRPAAEAWAEAATLPGRPADPLTGLATLDYLRVRLGEVHRHAGRHGLAPDWMALLVVTVDLTAVVGWSRLVAQVLVAEALREVFDGGETVATLGPSTAVVLAPREPDLTHRAAAAWRLIADRLAADPSLAAARLGVRVERLPGTEAEALRVLREVARA